MTEEASAWTLYWSNNTPQSCIASQNTSDADAIEAIWCEFVSGLKHDAKILDLATGNGAVPRAMLRERQSYHITAVDQANIAPLKYLEDPGHLQQVKFIGGIDVAKLPMAAQSFDALSSQFGIEYGDLAAVAPQVFRVLQHNGQFQFLIHHRGSAIVSPNTLLVEELENCLCDGGLVRALLAFLEGTCSASELDRKGQQYLKSNGKKTRQISGQLFQGIGMALKAADKDMNEASRIAENMVTRIKAEYARLSQMRNASLNNVGMQRFKEQLKDSGLIVDEPKTMEIGTGKNKALIGWLLTGYKP